MPSIASQTRNFSFSESHLFRGGQSKLRTSDWPIPSPEQVKLDFFARQNPLEMRNSRAWQKGCGKACNSLKRGKIKVEKAFLLLCGVSPSIWSHQIASDPMLAGRQKSCAIYIRHETVSREHATFREELGIYWVTDCGSRNGTFVNSKPVKESVICFGDLIQLGDVVLKIENETYVMQCSAAFQTIETKSFRLPDEDNQPAYESAIQKLSPTQARVLRRLLTGKSEKEMAAELFISPHTIHSHIRVVYRELGVTSRPELMALFINRATSEISRIEGS